MSINKVVYGGNTLIDLSNDTVTAAKMLEGTTAHDKAGNPINGTIANNGAVSETMDGLNTKSVTVPAGYTSGGTVALDDTIDNLADEQSALLDQIATALAGKAAASPAEPELQEKTVTPSTSEQTVTPDSGYDGLSKVTVNAMPTATQATPSITVSSSGLITAKATQSAGYVSAGTKSATKQLTVQAAQTITPGTSNKTISSGRYLTGTQTIKGDANLVAANIAEGVSIFGVTGTHSGGEDVSAETTEYTAQLDELESTINSLPDAGSGSGGGEIQYEIVTIPAGATSATYTLPRVTNAYGSMTEWSEFPVNTIISVCDNLVSFVAYVDTYSEKVETDTNLIYYNKGTITFEVGVVNDAISLLLVNDPSKETLDTCTE